MSHSTNTVFTEKFTTLKQSLPWAETAVNTPLSTSYDTEKHGESLQSFKNHVDFVQFRDNYYNLVDNILKLAIDLKITDSSKTLLTKQLAEFKSHLFDPAYCDARPDALWNKVREHLEALKILLTDSKNSKQKRLDVIIDLGPNLLVCTAGVVSHLQEAIQRLNSDSDVMARAKEMIVEQLVNDFVRETGLDELTMEVHYVNAFVNCFANDLGINKRPHEKMVTIKNDFVKKNEVACHRFLTEKLPFALVSHLSEELCLTGRQVLQSDGLDVEALQNFSNSSIGSFFDGAGEIKNTLFVEDEHSGFFTVINDSRSLHWLVAQFLMDKGWLNAQEKQKMMDLGNGASLHTLAGYWFLWENKGDKRLPTADELFKLYKQLPLKEGTQLPAVALRLLNLSIEQGCAEAAIELLQYYRNKEIDEINLPSLECYRLASDHGCFYAQYQLGLIYLFGKKVNRDVNKAFKLFELAEKSGYLDVQKEVDKEIELFESAVKNGSFHEQYKLAKLYLDIKKIDKAIEMFTLAAANGCNWSHYKLGKIYLDRKEVDKAIEMFTLSAANGCDWSHYELGKIYLDRKEVDKAIEMFTLSAANGCDWSHYELGKIYLNKKELGKAFEMFKLTDGLKKLNLIGLALFQPFIRIGEYTFQYFTSSEKLRVGDAQSTSKLEHDIASVSQKDSEGSFSAPDTAPRSSKILPTVINPVDK